MLQDLQQELKRLRAERAAADERARLLEEEKARLEKELLELRSQGHAHHLSLSDLQDRLARAYADRDEMARRLKLAEEALKDKVRVFVCLSRCLPVCCSFVHLFVGWSIHLFVCSFNMHHPLSVLQDTAYRDIEKMYQELNKELRRLQQQLKDLSSPAHVTVTHHHHEAVTPPKSPKPNDKVKRKALI